MSWEIALLGALIAVIAGIALWSMRVTKRSEFASFGGGQSVDTDALASKIAQAVGKEMREALAEHRKEMKKMGLTGGSRQYVRSHEGDSGGQITMDESIIPTTQVVQVEATNLDKASSEQKVIDKGLGESKSKLAGLLKNRKKKE